STGGVSGGIGLQGSMGIRIDPTLIAYPKLSGGDASISTVHIPPMIDGFALPQSSSLSQDERRMRNLRQFVDDVRAKPPGEPWVIAGMPAIGQSNLNSQFLPSPSPAYRPIGFGLRHDDNLRAEQ